MAELLEKIPTDKCWAITAQNLLRFALLSGSKCVVPLLGKGDGFFTPIWGQEKFEEINTSTITNVNRNMILWVKKTFAIPVENASGAAKLGIVWTTLQSGPEWEHELVEATRKRAVVRYTKCGWMERYKEFGIEPEFTFCEPVHRLSDEKALMVINPKISFKFVKAIPFGDPYCELVYEFKEDE
jgi:hypothetical protein